MAQNYWREVLEPESQAEIQTPQPTPQTSYKPTSFASKILPESIARQGEALATSGLEGLLGGSKMLMHGAGWLTDKLGLTGVSPKQRQDQPELYRNERLIPTGFEGLSEVQQRDPYSLRQQLMSPEQQDYIAPKNEWELAAQQATQRVATLLGIPGGRMMTRIPMATAGLVASKGAKTIGLPQHVQDTVDLAVSSMSGMPDAQELMKQGVKQTLTQASKALGKAELTKIGEMAGGKVGGYFNNPEVGAFVGLTTTGAILELAGQKGVSQAVDDLKKDNYVKRDQILAETNHVSNTSQVLKDLVREEAEFNKIARTDLNKDWYDVVKAQFKQTRENLSGKQPILKDELGRSVTSEQATQGKVTSALVGPTGEKIEYGIKQPKQQHKIATVEILKEKARNNKFRYDQKLDPEGRKWLGKIDDTLQKPIAKTAQELPEFGKYHYEAEEIHAAQEMAKNTSSFMNENKPNLTNRFLKDAIQVTGGVIAGAYLKGGLESVVKLAGAVAAVAGGAKGFSSLREYSTLLQKSPAAQKIADSMVDAAREGNVKRFQTRALQLNEIFNKLS